MPLLVRYPRAIKPATVHNELALNIDLAPTLLSLARLQVPSDMDGRSLVPTLLAAARGEPAPGPDPTGIAHIDQNWGQRNLPPAPNVAVRDGKLRYVRVPDDPKPLEQLFDIDGDPKEIADRASERPDDVARLRAIADGYLATSPHWGAAPRREIEDFELNQLRALGYAVP